MKLLIGVLLMSTLFIGCEKINNNIINKKNYLKIGDKEYDLSEGLLSNGGTDANNATEWHDGYNTGLCLYSGLSLQRYPDYPNDGYLVGDGYYIFFLMFSSSGKSFDDGEYTFSDAEIHPIGTFCYGDYTIKDKEIKDGKIIVSKDGDEYNITFDCIDEDGTRITGSYEGILHYIRENS